MKLNQLKQTRLEIAREEYKKLFNPVVDKLLGEYGTFEWVLYKTDYPVDFWKRDLPQETVREKLHKAIYDALLGMVCETIVKAYGRTTGPSEYSRVVSEARLCAYAAVNYPDKISTGEIAVRMEDLQKASTYLWEYGVRKLAKKLGFDGDSDSLAVALNELYPAPLEYDYNEAKKVDIEQEIDNGCLFFFYTIEEAKDQVWGCTAENIPQSSFGYLVATDEERDSITVVPIRPETPWIFGDGDDEEEETPAPIEEINKMLFPAKIDYTPVLKTLKDAIGKGVLVRIRYVSRDGEETVRLVRPDALEEKATGWYLDAYCTMREDQRTFFVPRIREAVVTDESVPKDNGEAQNEQKPEQPVISNVLPIPTTRQHEPQKPVVPVTPRVDADKDAETERDSDGYDRGRKNEGSDWQYLLGTYGFWLILLAEPVFVMLEKRGVFVGHEALAMLVCFLLQVIWLIILTTYGKL